MCYVSWGPQALSIDNEVGHREHDSKQSPSTGGCPNSRKTCWALVPSSAS